MRGTLIIKHLRPHSRALAALALCLCAAAAGAGDNGAQAQAKLAAVRERIAELTTRVGLELKQRDALSARLREAELDVTSTRQRLESLNTAQLAAERRRNELRAEHSRSQNALVAERDALAALVRAQYMIGRNDELKMLLNQSNPAAAGRMLELYGYFARARAARIEEIGAEEARLTELVEQIDETAARLKSLKEDVGREVAELERARRERASAVAALSEQVQSGNQELTKLQREEHAIESLVADLARVIQDFPIDSSQGFEQLRGKLPWPVAGKMTARTQETRTNGAPTAVRANGVMIAGTRGAKVRAPYFGRVVYADWLQGMGMLLIIAHSGNYMTLYGHAEVLYKSVGDAVSPGDVVAALSDTGGAAPQLYFEIRDGRKPVDPKAWLKATP